LSHGFRFNGNFQPISGKRAAVSTVRSYCPPPKYRSRESVILWNGVLPTSFSICLSNSRTPVPFRSPILVTTTSGTHILRSGRNLPPTSTSGWLLFPIAPAYTPIKKLGWALNHDIPKTARVQIKGEYSGDTLVFHIVKRV